MTNNWLHTHKGRLKKQVMRGLLTMLHFRKKNEESDGDMVFSNAIWSFTLAAIHFIIKIKGFKQTKQMLLAHSLQNAIVICKDKIPLAVV